MVPTENLAWFREHLLNDILPRWLTHAPTANGLFFAHLGRTWERRDKDICTLVSQTRLLYNFSVGYRLTGQAEYIEAVHHGADALLRFFQDAAQGGWYWSCNLNGEILDFDKHLYGHAFVIFGLANAAEVTERKDLKQAAFDTWELVRSRFREERGGFVGKLTREFASLPHIPSQNPLMHLFEALLMLSIFDNSGRVRQDGEELAAFVLHCLRRKHDGILPELFDEEWRELSAENGGRIDIGHAFEWAYLLSHAVECGWSQDYLKAAARFLEYGLALGFDATNGGIISPVTPAGAATLARKGWWEQCEAIRALLHFGVVREHTEVWEPLAKIIAFVQKHFVDQQHGGWYTRPPITASQDQACLDKGSEWKVDYHIVGMCAEAIRLTSKI